MVKAMNAHSKYKTIRRSTLRLIIAALAGVMMLGSVGCDESKVVAPQDEQADNTNDEQDKQDKQDDENADPNDDEASGEQPIDDHGHGSSEEENVVIEAGYMNGSWRAGAGDQDEPAVYFDTFQDEGDPEISGEYTMGFAIYDLYDGETGELETATFDDGTLTIMWNPTTDRDEMLILEATQVDEDTLKGTVTAKRNIEMNLPVILTRASPE